MIEENLKIKTINKKNYPKENFIKDSAMLHRKQFKNFLQILHSARKNFFNKTVLLRTVQSLNKLNCSPAYFFRPARIIPAIRAVNGAVEARPKLPAIVFMISDAT